MSSSPANKSKAPIRLSPRLSAAASYIKKGMLTADIGSDHCYLPIYLLDNGITDRVIATDINEGPLKKAALNLKRRGLEGQVTLIRADGLDGIEEYKPDCILICGMGGELICNIISASEYPKRSGVSLILQPMTKSNELRRYLCEHGFDIIDETLAAEDKIYEIIFAVYDGAKHEYSEAELLVGRRNIEKRQDCFVDFLRHRLAYIRQKSDGLARAGLDNSAQLAVINQLEEYGKCDGKP